MNQRGSQSPSFHACFPNVCQTPKEEPSAGCLLMYVSTGTAVNLACLPQARSELCECHLPSPSCGVPASLPLSSCVLFQDFQLDAAATYCKAARQLVEREKFGEIRQLLKCVSESGMAAQSDRDTVLLNCVEAFRRIPPQVRPPQNSAPASVSVSSHPRLFFSLPHHVPETLQDPSVFLTPL